MPLYRHGTHFVLWSGVFFGLLGYFGITILNENISVYNMLFWRFLVSAFFIFCLLLAQPCRLKLSAKETLKIICYGAIFYNSSSILYFTAAQYIGSGLAMVIFFTYPAVVLLINLIHFRSKISKIYWLAFFIITIGMICLSYGKNFSYDIFGLALGLLAAFMYAIYIIVSKNCKAPPLVATFWLSIGASFSSLLCAFADHSFYLPSHSKVWLNIIGIGIICTTLPLVLLLKGLQSISSLQASMLSVLEPIFVVIFGILLLGEKVDLVQIIGCLTVLSGSFLSIIEC